MKKKEIRVLMVEPGKYPREMKIGNDLDSLQKAVSIDCDRQGLIEIIGIENGVCILCNEEGKLLGLEGNRRLGDDIITGVFYVVGENRSGDLISLTDCQIEKYSKHFWHPEVFTPDEIARRLICVSSLWITNYQWRFWICHQLTIVMTRIVLTLMLPVPVVTKGELK